MSGQDDTEDEEIGEYDYDEDDEDGLGMDNVSRSGAEQTSLPLITFC